MTVYVNLNRDTSKDIQLGNPTTVYTDSTTLTTGMTLYDNTGTDTGLTIGTVNQDGSFDIGGSRTISWIMECANQSALTEDNISITINGNTYGSALYTTHTLTFDVGDTITWSYAALGGNVPTVSESSNTNYIALGIDAYKTDLTFVMPNENLEFTLHTDWVGPV